MFFTIFFAVLSFAADAASSGSAFLHAGGDRQLTLRGNSADGESGACSCLAWHDVYKSRGVSCGAGGEFPGPMRMKAFFAKEFCTHFFEAVKGNFCAQAHFNQQKTDQWCYVSSDCDSGKHVKGVEQVKWKLCKEGEDETLGAKTPKELYRMSQEQDLDIGLLAKMAYPVWHGKTWKEVHSFFRPAESQSSTKKISAPLQAQLEELRKSGKPMLFDNGFNPHPFHIMMGKQYCIVEFTEDMKKLQSHPIAEMARRKEFVDPFKHPGQIAELQCD